MNIDDLGFAFDKNIKRVRNLIEIYDTLKENKKNKKLTETDLLRVSVVLLHASLEDFLRNLLKIKLPVSTEKELNKIPFYNPYTYNPRNTKFSLGELLNYKGKAVEDIITISVEKYLDRESFNNTTEISAALRRVGLEITDEIKSHYAKLEQMISRRHDIVHQADREKSMEKGFHNLQYINRNQVQNWIEAVDKFIVELTKQL